jgi:hypothetical protein
MRIVAIEELKRQITDQRTRVSMDEVLSCFYSDNLRGAVVMLYVTVITDLYYKLCDLADIYDDSGAKDIRAKIEKEWKEKPTSSQWETTILEDCHNANKVLTSISYRHAKELRQERHSCAHPVIGVTEGLYHPNQAKVQGMIIDMLREVLCRPNFLGKGFFDVFTDDIAIHNDSFASNKELAKYIQEKYLNKINNMNEEYELFKKLWKFVFRLDDDSAKKNRLANYTVLLRLYERNESDFNQKIKNDAGYYENNTSLGNRDLLELIVKCFNEYRSLTEAMTTSFHTELENRLEGAENQDIKAIAFYLSTNLKEYCRDQAGNIHDNNLRYMQDFLKKETSVSIAIDVSIGVYGESDSFDRADECFDYLIEPMLTQMSDKQLAEVIQVSNSNGQIYNRRAFNASRRKIKDAMNKANPDFDYSPYNNFEWGQ